MSSLVDKNWIEEFNLSSLDVVVTNKITENMTYFEDKLNKFYADTLKRGKEVTNIPRNRLVHSVMIPNRFLEERNAQLIQVRERKSRGKFYHSWIKRRNF